MQGQTGPVQPVQGHCTPLFHRWPLCSPTGPVQPVQGHYTPLFHSWPLCGQTGPRKPGQWSYTSLFHNRTLQERTDLGELGQWHCSPLSTTGLHKTSPAVVNQLGPHLPWLVISGPVSLWEASLGKLSPPPFHS